MVSALLFSNCRVGHRQGRAGLAHRPDDNGS